MIPPKIIQLKKNGKKNVVCTIFANHFFPISLISRANNSGTKIPKTIFVPEMINVFLTASQKPSNWKIY